jgi:YD repeat-containing protein
MRGLRIALAVLAALVVLSARGQDHQNVAKGFTADKTYDVGNLDAINLFNGNLNLSVPIGQSYVVSPTLSYRFVLTYYGLEWFTADKDYEWIHPGTGARETKNLKWETLSIPKRDDNAGAGWRMSFGTLEDGYRSGDGAKHLFWPRLHHVDIVDGSGNTPPDPDPDADYTNDGSYLRRRVLADGEIEIDFPNGVTHKFIGTELREMRDTFGNVVSFTPSPVDPITKRSTLTVSDGSRTHVLTFQKIEIDDVHENDPTTFTLLVKAELAAFGNKTAVYDFEYHGGESGILISRRQHEGLTFSDCSVPPTIRVPLLSRIVFPCTTDNCTRDSYSFNYDRGPVDVPAMSSHILAPNAPLTFEDFFNKVCVSRGAFTGQLEKLTLPMRGSVEWTYRRWTFPPEGGKRGHWCPGPTGPGPCIEKPFVHVIGVGSRVERDLDGDMVSRRTYETDPPESITNPDVAITTVTTYAPPDSNTVATRALSYYNVARTDRPDLNLLEGEYGLPYTRVTDPDPDTPVLNPGPYPGGTSDARNGYISTKLYDGNDNLLTYTYVKYESDSGDFDRGQQDNRRVSVQSNVQKENGELFHTTTVSSDFDGIMNYRKSEKFGSVSPGRSRLRFTNYNAGATAHPVETSKWLLGLYTTSSVADRLDGVTQASFQSESCFEASTGFLLRSRTIRGGDDEADLLSVFTRTSASGGNVATETHYGGDVSGKRLPDNFATCTAGVGTLPISYKLSHEYQAGTRKSTKYDGVDFKSLDAVVDDNTGLVSATIDPELRRTEYVYDLLGRITELRPPAQAWTKYTYDLQAAVPLTRVQQFVGTSTNSLTESVNYYDGLGRIIQQKRRMPHAWVNNVPVAQWATTAQTYDTLGRKERTSVPAFTSSGAFSADFDANDTVFSYDILGRVRTVTQPDLKKVETEYVGPRETTRKVRIASIGAPAEGEESATTEVFDYLGRLAEVRERSGANGASTTTTYAYDPADRLTKVTAPGQTRTFTYDGAGFLLAEKHPESADKTYTYDARGHVVTKTVGSEIALKFDYDSAERLRAVTDTKGPQELKRFEFDTTELGRLDSQSRINAFADGTKYTVKDAFTYEVPTGRIKTKVTTIAKGNDAPLTFTHDYEYDALGALKKLQYPKCATCGSVANATRDVALTHQDGLLTNIAGVTAPLAVDNVTTDEIVPGGITYSASGAVHLVQHAKANGAAGILDTFTPDPSGMARVGAISFAGATTCGLKITSFPDRTFSRERGGTLTVVAEGAPVLHYRWYEGALGDTSRPVGTDAPSFATGPLASAKTYWVEVRNDCDVVRDEARVDVIDCGGEFSITALPDPVAEGQKFELSAPSLEGATYKWYSGTPAARQLLATTTGSKHEITLGISVPTSYFVEVQDPTCFTTWEASNTLLVTPCGKPQQRSIIVTPVNEGGTVFRLSVADDQPGVTYQWYQGELHTDLSKPIGTGASVDVAPAARTTYWLRMKRVCGTLTTTTDTEFVIVQPECMPFIFKQPESASAAIGAGATVSTTVVPGGSGPFRFQWHDAVTGLEIGQATGATFTWTFDGTERQKTVYAMVRQGTTPDELQRQPAKSRDVTLAFLETPQRIASYTEADNVYGAVEPGRLSVRMEPAPSDDHKYTYRWFTADDDGGPGIPIAGVGPENSVSSQSTVYWVEVTGSHAVAGSTQRVSAVSTSPKMFVMLYGRCELPPVRIEQSVRHICDESQAPAVIFRAVADWHDVRFQWYAGTPGDTRWPITADAGKPEQLTVPGHKVTSVWVRASLECGATRDSEAAFFTRGECAPVVLAPIPSITVHWKESAKLSVDPVDRERRRYEWFDGVFQTPAAGGGPDLVIPSVTKSGRHWVRVTDKDCEGSQAHSNVAVIRVASAPGMTPPVWQEEVWTDEKVPVTLNAQTAGGSAWEWFLGEVGDERNPIGGATLSTYTTPQLQADTRYWVRVHGTGGALIDSPTMTVRVCVLPLPTVDPLLLDRTVSVTGETVSFLVPMKGTNLTYQWYEGKAPITTKPIGRPVNLLKVSPSVTTEYWVRVTGRCGAGGTDINVWDSPTFKASVCPAGITATAAKPKVMPGKTTTLTANTTTNGVVTFKWYIGQPGDMSKPVPAGEAATITTPAITQTTTFWCRITSGTCGRNSDPVTVAICDSPSVSWTAATRETIERGEFHIMRVNVDAPELPVTVTFYEGVSGDVAGSRVLTSGTNTSYGVNQTETKSFWVRVTGGPNGCYADTPTKTVQVCIPKITTHPQPATLDKAANANASATLTVAADLTGVTYQWYIGASGNITSPIAGATTTSLTVSPSSDTTYWARVTGSCNISKDSTAATVTVCNPPVINTLTASRAIESGDSTSIGVSALGTELTYKWYRGASGVTTNPLTNATSAGVSVAPTQNTSYWCRITSRGLCWKDTAAVPVTVCTNPSITTQPKSQTVFSGTPITVSVVASSPDALTYQWYTGTPGTTTNPISGATGTSYTVTPAAPTTYWVRVTTSVCSTDSAGAAISFCTYPQVVSGDTRSIGYNESTSLSLVPTSPVYDKTITWYRGNVGDRSTPVRTGTGSNLTYDTPALTQTTVYWAEFVHNGCTSRTNAFTVNVCKPKITSEPSGTTVASGTSVPLSVGTTPIAGQTFQWYTGVSGNTANAIGGARSASLTVAPQSTTSYWVRVTGTCGTSDDSAAAVITVCNPPAIGSVSPTRFIAPGDSTSVSASATGSNLTYQWYSGASGNTANPLSGATFPSTQVSPSATTTYWCRVTSENLCQSDSAAITVDVCAAPSITAQPQSKPIFNGESAPLSVAASASGAMTYQWYTGLSGDTSSPISGATSASLTVTPTTTTSYWVRVKSSVCKKDSATATITLCTYAPVVSGDEKLIGYNQSASLSLPILSPSLEKTITWYRGNVGDRSTPVKTGTGTNLTYDTPTLTQTTTYWAEFTNNGCTSRTNAYTVRVCKPSVTSEPAGKTITRGESATVTAGTTPITGQTFQWYTGTPGTTTNPVSGATAASLTVTPTATTSYWVRVTGTCGVADDSAAAVINVCNPPVIGSVSPTRFIESGDSTSVSVSATGSNVTYQWFAGASGNTSNPLGGTSASMQVSPTATTTYWCRVTSDAFCSVNSAAITVDVCEKPGISTQPVSKTIFRNSSTTLSVGATSARPMTYQWYAGASGTTSSPLSGQTASTVTVTPTEATSYWVRVTSSVCSVDSAAARVSFCTFGSTFNVASPVNIASGQSVTLDFPPMSPVVEKRITWYRGVSGDRTNPVRTAASATSLDYTTPVLTATTQYWVELEYEGCITVSNTVTVSVCKPAITAQPQSATILQGAPKTLSVTATGSPSYQWYIGTSGVTTNPISGATGATHTVSPAATTSYWVRATGCGTTADSATATITICTAPVVDSLTKTANSAPGFSGSVTVVASGGTGLTYQWYRGQSGDTSRLISGATADKYTFSLQASEYYWVRITSACNGSSVDSAAILYSVQPRITANPDDTTICALNDTATFSVAATGNFLTYQWYRNDGILTGETNSTLTTQITNVDATYYVYVHSGTSSNRSLSAGVTITGKPSFNITKTQTSSTSTFYRLTADVLASDETLGVTYQWYRGALGDTANPLGTGSYVSVQPSPPVTYWVRVAFSATGCYRDKATSF